MDPKAFTTPIVVHHKKLAENNVINLPSSKNLMKCFKFKSICLATKKANSPKLSDVVILETPDTNKKPVVECPQFTSTPRHKLAFPATPMQKFSPITLNGKENVTKSNEGLDLRKAAPIHPVVQSLKKTPAKPTIQSTKKRKMAEKLIVVKEAEKSPTKV